MRLPKQFDHLVVGKLQSALLGFEPGNQGINIFVDPNAVTLEDGSSLPAAELKVSLQMNDVPLETALRYLLRSAKADGAIGYGTKLGLLKQDGILVVTARSKSMVRKVYPVGALVGNEEEKNARALIQAIVNTVEPESWSLISTGMAHPINPFTQNIFNPVPGGGGMFGMVGNQFGMGGGNMFGMMGAGQPPTPATPDPRAPSADGQGASIAYFPGTKALVVRQYLDVHHEIEELLSNLAESKKNLPPDDGSQ